jgi:cytochrome bd-type quinol oxidase subunit 2
VNVEWMALFQVAVVTIAGAVAVVGLMSAANWLLLADDDGGHAPLGRRLAGYALIALMALLIAAGIWLIVHKHVSRLLGLG